MRGLVIARSGAKIEVWLPDSQRVVVGIPRGKLRKGDVRIYCGDWVNVNPVSHSEVAIDSVEERKNLLPQPPVANVDKLVLIVSWKEPDFSNIVLDGMISMAEFFNTPVVIVLNKVDLIGKRQLQQVRNLLSIYEGLGYTVLCTSAKRGDGLDSFCEAIKGNLVVLAGPSGVGKSSLLNKVIPGAMLRTGEISERTGRGKHATTEVRLLPNPQGGWVADTPGFQRVDLPRFVSLETLPKLYREFTQFECEFSDCSHTVEPNCGVMQALKLGEVAKERYQTYLYWREAIRQWGVKG
jgi:ribosome biogenesis GTPase